MGPLGKNTSLLPWSTLPCLCGAADGALSLVILSTVATEFQIISKIPLEGQKGPG